jgi:hypothetical protein
MTDQPKNKFQQVGRVKVIKGSILFPHDAGLRIILNIANTAGKMESPLYAVFEKKWPKAKQEVRGSFATKTGAYKLGTIASNTALQSDVWCVSVLCQDDNLNTDVVALEKSLKEVCKLAKYERASLHISTLLTEAIPELQDLITTQLVEQGVAVCYYEEPTV